MDTVSVAQLKSRLSHYLREVRAGRSFTVMNRDIPVATLGPWEPEDVDDLDVTEPAPGAASLFDLLRAPEVGLPDGAELIRRDREASDARLDADVRRAPRRDDQDEVDDDE